MPQHTIRLTSPSGRVKLLPPDASEDGPVSTMRSHPVTRRFLRFFPESISVGELRARRESRADNTGIVDFHVHLVEDDGTTALAGTTGIFNINEGNGSCEAGILIAPDQHYKGVGTEALYVLLRWVFEDRKMHRVTFETAEGNVPMRAWLEKVVQAKLEAHKRECWKEEEGSFTDVKGYSILQWEWIDRVKAMLEERLNF